MRLPCVLCGRVVLLETQEQFYTKSLHQFFCGRCHKMLECAIRFFVMTYSRNSHNSITEGLLVVTHYNSLFYRKVLVNDPVHLWLIFSSI